jgi:ribosome recycling factor
MNPSQLVDQAKSKFAGAVERFEGELKKVRTGRAHPSMLEGITIEAYGQQMPLIQAGNVTAPEAQLLQITPFDPNNLQAISAAIRNNQSLGMNPMDDGRVVRVPIPPLTEDRRKEYVRLLSGKVEDCLIAMRSIRHDTLKDLDQAKKDKDISEDEHKRLTKQIDDLMTDFKNQVDAASKAKETEIMTV